MARLRIGVLISGRGSNLQALIDELAGASAPAEIVLVIANVAGAAGLDRAQKAGIETAIIDNRTHVDRQSFELALESRLRASGIELICLAGFMKILSDRFVESWRDRLINIHPSLLPAFPGLHTHDRAIAAGARFAGCTVHFVRPQVDRGPIVVQAAVPVHPGDSAETLAERVLAAEHRIYPMAVRWIAEGRVTVSGERVTIAGTGVDDRFLVNPSKEQGAP